MYGYFSVPEGIDTLRVSVQYMGMNNTDTVQTIRSQRGGTVIHLIANPDEADDSQAWRSTLCGKALMAPYLVGFKYDADKPRCPKCVSALEASK